MVRDNVKACMHTGYDLHLGLCQPRGCSLRGDVTATVPVPWLAWAPLGPQPPLPDAEAHQELPRGGEAGEEEALGYGQRTEKRATERAGGEAVF